MKNGIGIGMDIGIGGTMVIPRYIAATALSQNLLVPSQSLIPTQGGGKLQTILMKPSFCFLRLVGLCGVRNHGKNVATLRCFHSSSVQHCTSSHCLVPLAAQPWVSPAVSKENCSLTMIKGRFNMVKFQYLLFHVMPEIPSKSSNCNTSQFDAICTTFASFLHLAGPFVDMFFETSSLHVTHCHSIVIHIDAVVCSPFSTSPGRSPLYSGKFQWRIPAWANSIIDWLWLVVEVMSSMRVMWLEWLMRIKFKATKLVKPTSTIVVDAALNQPVNSGSYNILSKEI